jgi:hypothetical protein
MERRQITHTLKYSNSWPSSVRFSLCIHSDWLYKILWHIDPLLGNNRETNSEMTAIAMKHIHKYAAVLELLGSGLHTIMELLLEVVFSMGLLRVYHSTNQVQVVSAVQWSKLVGEWVSE